MYGLTGCVVASLPLTLPPFSWSSSVASPSDAAGISPSTCQMTVVSQGHGSGSSVCRLHGLLVIFHGSFIRCGGGVSPSRLNTGTDVYGFSHNARLPLPLRRGSFAGDA